MKDIDLYHPKCHGVIFSKVDIRDFHSSSKVLTQAAVPMFLPRWRRLGLAGACDEPRQRGSWIAERAWGPYLIQKTRFAASLRSSIHQHSPHSTLPQWPPSVSPTFSPTSPRARARSTRCTCVHGRAPRIFPQTQTVWTSHEYQTKEEADREISTAPPRIPTMS